MVAFGRVESFLNIVTSFASDAITYTARWVKTF
jgi:hypothetical protein